MPRIKTESKTPRPSTPARGNGGGGSSSGRKRSGVHPAMMFSNKKMEEILQCDDIHLDMLKHATYKIMKDEPAITRQDLRARLAAQEAEFESMLSGERWQGKEYPKDRTFEEDLDMLLIKIMSIARQKLKREAKKKELKRDQEDEGYETTSPTKSPSPTSHFRPPQSPLRNLGRSIRNRRVSSNAGEQQEEDFMMSGGAGDNDDVAALTGVRPSIEDANDQQEDQTPSAGLVANDNIVDAPEGPQNTLPDGRMHRNASMDTSHKEEEGSEDVFGTSTPWRTARERSSRMQLTVRRQSTRTFGVQDVIELD